MRLATIAHLKRELGEGLLQVTLLTPKQDSGLLVHTPELRIHCIQINFTPPRIETADSTHPQVGQEIAQGAQDRGGAFWNKDGPNAKVFNQCPGNGLRRRRPKAVRAKSRGSYPFASET